MAVRAQNLRVTYSVGKHSVHALDIPEVVFNCGTTAVMGPSGSGKSTLLHALAGRVPHQGSIHFSEGEGGGSDQGDAARTAIITQDSTLINFLSVRENLTLCAQVNGASTDIERLTDILDEVGLKDLADRLPGTLSGGQRQRAAIARALAGEAPVILADEPTAALDSANSAVVAQVLGDVGRRSGRVVIVATHDPDLAAAMDRTLHLRDGQLG